MEYCYRSPWIRNWILTKLSDHITIAFSYFKIWFNKKIDFLLREYKHLTYFTDDFPRYIYYSTLWNNAKKKIPFINLFQLFFRFILFSYFSILSLRFYYVFITLSFCFLLTIDRLQTTYRFKVQEKSPVFFIFCRKKSCFDF